MPGRTPANTNARKPIVILRPTREGGPLYRALARVLVRRELCLAAAFPDGDHCEQQKVAG